MSHSFIRRKCRSRLHLQPLELRQMLTSLSDEFDAPSTLGEWRRINETEGWNAEQLETFDINTTQTGRLVMVPHTVSWYENWRGPLVYKEVSGDFAITTQVHVSDRDDVGDSDADDVPDGASYSLAGLMIRTPRDITNPATDWQPGTRNPNDPPNGENYVFLSLGHGVDGRFSFEVKTTINSRSNLELTPVDVSSAEIQLARVGTSVFAMYRLPGSEWTVHRRYDRPDMPETMQIGLVTYSDWGGMNHIDPFIHNGSVYPAGEIDPSNGRTYSPDLVAGFEYARIVEPEIPAELAGIDLLTQATDEQLLSFLGEPANIPAPEGGVVGRHLFHNDSAFDGESDDNAIATDKSALLPGDGPATRDNYTSSVAGITGLMIDLDLPDDGTQVSVNDFVFRVGNDDDTASWTQLVGDVLPALHIRPDAGSEGSDRVTLRWPAGTIVSTWLEVTMLATSNTGLTEDDLFYFGSAPGDSSGSPIVDAADYLAVRANPTSFLDVVDATHPLDHNRDGRVNVADLIAVRDHATTLETALVLISPPANATLQKGIVAALASSERGEPKQAGTSLMVDDRPHLATSADDSDQLRAEAVDRLMASFG